MQTRPSHPGWLLPELLAEIASFLPSPALYSAVCVSRYWRATLLASPLLWDDISFSLDEKRKNRWTDVLELLLARNAGRPLSIKLIWPEEDNRCTDWVALHSVCALVASHMPHIKSLSFNIPDWHDTQLLWVPAPILDTLEVDNSYGAEIQMLPINLFAGIAPRLRSVHLQEVDLPSRCPALRTVTKLVLNSFFAFQVSHLHSLLVDLPLLDELQVSARNGYERISIEQPSEHAIDLHVTFGPGLESILGLFPRARAVSYDFTQQEHTSEPDPADVAATVARAIRTVPSPKSMLICWEPTLYDQRSLAIVLDGRKVIEHVQLHVLRPALTPRLMESVVQSVTRLTVPEELWEVFEDCTLPPNLDVTIIVGQVIRTMGCTPTGKLYLSTPSVQKSVRSLALARPCDSSRDPYWILSATVLQAFVANAVTPGSLQSIVLHGIVLDGPVAFDSGEITVRTVEDMTYPEVDEGERTRDQAGRRTMVHPDR